MSRALDSGRPISGINLPHSAGGSTANQESHQRSYASFICYSHADNRETGRQWGNWLQHVLEEYEVPPELIGRRNVRGEEVPASLFPVFRDEEELAADADLSQTIRRAEERSRTMIVICSPNAARSRFVEQEIRYFHELGHADSVLALIVDGEPGAGDPGWECLPLPLHGADHEPIAADVRPGGVAAPAWTTAAAYRKSLANAAIPLPRGTIDEKVREYESRLELAKLKVIAGALGVPLGELTRRTNAFELERARRRTRTLRAWLTTVSALATAAAIAGVVAYRNQRQARAQTVVAQQQREQAIHERKRADTEAERAILERDRALRASYVNTVRQAAMLVASGKFFAARQTLLTVPSERRRWEWWFLAARCGPAPVPLPELARIDAKTAAALQASLNEVAQSDDKPLDEHLTGAAGVFLDYKEFGGYPGTSWEARRGTADRSVLLNGFSTALFGEIHGVTPPVGMMVSWRARNVGLAHAWPTMATGDDLDPDQPDHVAFLRDRYIVGNARTQRDEDKIEHSGAVDLTTWADEAEANDLVIQNDPDSEDLVTIRLRPDGFEPKDVPQLFDFTSGTMTPRPRAKLQPGEAVERASLSEKERYQYVMTKERGPRGPLLLSRWGHGNVRLRNGITGEVIGESLWVRKDGDWFTNAGAAAIVPGTELVAGSFWWRDDLVSGVVDLRHGRLVTEFDDEDLLRYATEDAYASVRVTPDGNEVALDIAAKNYRHFIVWSVKNGKQVYDDVIPLDWDWHPDGRFVVIGRPDGVTELRKSFASPPFATIDGIAVRSVRVQEIGEPDRVLIGNAVIDTTTWERVIELPLNTWVSRDGNRAIIESRRGIVDVVRLDVRQAGKGRVMGLRDTVLRAQIDDSQPHPPRRY